MKRLILSLFIISTLGLGQSFVTIAEARAQGDGASVAVRGVVTTPNLNSATNTEYGLQDGTGGLVIFHMGSPYVTLAVGDSVEVSGTLLDYYGKLEVVPDNADDITVISQNNSLPAFQVLTVANFVANSEDYESELIRINGVSITSGTWPTSSSTNLTISDDGGTSTVTIRIVSAVDIIGNPEPADPFDVQGIVTYAYGDHRILPRYYTDFNAVSFVSGTLSSNTTWDVGGSPYIVIDDIYVMPNDTLTIEPGVVIKIDGDKSIRIKGSLRAVGTNDNYIRFTKNNSTNWDQIKFDTTNDSSFFDYCIIEFGSNAIEIDGASFTYSPRVRILNSYISNNNGYGIWTNSNYGGLYVRNTVINNNDNGIYVHKDYGIASIENSKIVDNSGYGFRCNSRFSIINNQILRNNTGIFFTMNGTNYFRLNNIIGNTIGMYNNYTNGTNYTTVDSNNFDNSNYNFENGSSSSFTFENNWWGSTNTDTINASIMDIYENINLGPVDYDPFLTTPDTAAPPIPAQNVQITSSGYNFVNLSWDTSAIGDLAGYKVYYDTDATGYPYANSVDVSNATTYNLTGLNTGSPYYIAVTTYDTDGNESWYSAEAQATPVPDTLNVPVSYTTIQSALTAASEGDVVLVQPGTYTENIIWPETNGIKLISAGDSSNTIIDGGGVSSVIYMNPQTATIDTTTLIQGFKITNGLSVYGAGLLLNNTSPIVAKCLVNNNIGTGSGSFFYGAGVYIADGSPLIKNTMISQNYQIGSSWQNLRGGGLCISGGNAYLDLVTISNNTAGYGGGVFVGTNSNPTFKNVIILNNNATSGGGIKLEFCAPTFINTTIFNNTALYGGGVHLNGSEDFSNVNIVSNYPDGIHRQAGTGNNISNVNIIDHQSAITFSNNSSYQGSIIESNIMNNEFGINNPQNITYFEATNNYWGHSSGPYHPTQNTAGEGDSVNAFVNVDPWLTVPNTDAPPIPAQNTTVTSTGNDFISLKWDTSPLGDLAGYKLYYDSDSSGYPYTNSVDVGTDTSYTLSSLTLGTTYYLAVTTYDTDGNESWYSNEVTGTTRVMQAQSLDIGGDEDLQHMVSHTPSITFGYYDSMNETQTSYQIQVSTDSLFSSADMWDSGTITSSDTSVTYAGTTLVDGTTYYLRVRVASSDFWSDWSTLTFRMNTEPTTPVLVSPINNQVSGTPVGLKVLNATDAEGDAITYSFNVYSDVTLTTKLDSATAVAEGTDTTSWQITGSLPDNGQYFWTVSTNDGYEESAVSDAGSFLLNTDNNAPEAFILSMPLVDTEVQNLSPVFSWYPANDPDPIDTVYYKLMLDTPDPGVEVFDVGTDTSFQVTNALMDNTEYFWQVMAEDVIGFQTINEGGYQTFYTNVSNEPPSAFTILSPNDNSIQADLTPNFSWTTSFDPDPQDSVEYRLTIDGPPIVTNPWSFYVDTYETHYTPDFLLEDNTTFFYMVNAHDMNGESVLSNEVVFHTDSMPEPPLNFTTVSPINNVEGLATDVEFVWEETDDPDPVEEISYRVVYATNWEDSSTYVYSETIEDTTMVITLADNSQYYWLVEALDSDGFIVGSNNNTSNVIVVGTLAIDGDLIPVEFALRQNYPNPFNPVTTLRYDLPEQTHVNITVYDMLGRKVRTILNQPQDPGYKSLIWDATNDYGKPVSAGIYLYQIQAGEYISTKKMVLLK